MFINISPLKKYKDYRRLFIGQSVSLIGNMMSYAVVPFHIYALTKSNLLVGAVSLVQLFAVIVFGILGGAYADRLNRRTLMITSELLMIGVLAIMSLNALMPNPSVPLIFVAVGIFQSIASFHRPAMTALIQKLVPEVDFKAAASLGVFTWSIAAIFGPAIGGILIANIGFSGAYFLDLVSFIVSLFFLNKITKMPSEKVEKRPHVFSEIKEGLSFVLKKKEILGSYTIDIVAMIFAFPVALFPAMSVAWGGAKAAGFLYAGMGIGAFFITLFSAWTASVSRNGRALVLSACLWAFFIIWLGFAQNISLAMLCLILAGAADAMSGIFRSTLWNQLIPNTMRGRLSGIEMISYMSGPLLGNARAGYMASLFTVKFSLTSGGFICIGAVILTAFFLPKLWKA